jgi:hypothetical protein
MAAALALGLDAVLDDSNAFEKAFPARHAALAGRR